MKFLSLSIVLTVALAVSTSQNLSGQTAGSDQKIAEMQAMINNMQSELESLRAAQDSGSGTPVELTAPSSAAQPGEPTPAVSVLSPPQTTAAYPPVYNSAPMGGYYPPTYAPYGVPADPGFRPPPPVVIVDQPYCPNGFCGAGYGGYGGSGVYIGPNGWGFGVGGLQLDFHGHGGHGGKGYGGGNRGKGHGGGKKGHKH